ncbi:hypothetical protein [Corynebacterium dentalis]|uniref:hypothetical protein n=1 Tax=Corynebacterium dentalis TaxID=2014528 RepID=UPI00289633D2|nr:hypothetical protein [Corynebacterium dentalis]
MTLVQINVADVLGRAPEYGDKIIFRTKRIRGSDTNLDQVLVPREQIVPLVSGVAEVEVDPGSVLVQFRCGTSVDTNPIEVAVPRQDEPVSLRALLEGVFQYEEPVVSAVTRLVEEARRITSLLGSAEQIKAWTESSSEDAEAAGASASAAAGSEAVATAKAGEADASAQAAKVSEDAAKASETAAAGSAGAAASDRAAAGVSAAAAKSSEDAAKASETAAKQSETSASSSATAAADARDSAQAYAGGAQTQAQAAQASAGTSTTKAGEASLSASVAKDAEGKAKDSEDSAAASAAAAGESEVNAAASASAAGESEVNAQGSETAAESSAASAADSAAVAVDARDSAQSFADTAQTQAHAAQTQGDRAKTEADRAATSAAQAAETASSGVPDATASTRGKVRLAGDLGGTADAPTVPGLADKADLVGGQVPTSQLPAVALVKPNSVADRAGMLALSAQEGDVAVITAGADKGTYMLGSGAPSTFASWVKLVSPDAPVQSVNGQTGTVNLDAANVGAAPTSHTHTVAQVTGLQSALNDKAATTTVNARPALFSGAGAPPSTIAGAVVGDWWLNTTTMELHKITGV